MKRDSFIVRKEASRNPVSARHDSSGRVQRVIVSVAGNSLGNTTRAHAGLNLDGNITDSSEYSTEEEDEEDDASRNVVSKVYSLSHLLLSRNSACPKSTVEDSCCNPPLLKTDKRHLSWIKRNKEEIKVNVGRSCLLNGGLSPSRDRSVRPCKVILPRLPAHAAAPRVPRPRGVGPDTDSSVNSEPTQCGAEKPCDNKMTSNVNDAMAASSSSFTKPSFAAPQPTFISAAPLGQFGSTTISTVTSQVMAVPLPQSPVLVLSGSNTLANTATVVTSGALPTNLVLGSFPGSAMQMTAIPINKGVLGVGGPQAINIQTSDVIKVPVALNGGGVVLAPPPAPVLAPAPSQPTLSLPQFISQPGAVAVQGSVLSPAPAPAPAPGPSEAGDLKTEQKLEPSYNEDGSVEWRCKVCAKVCASEHELSIHKKRHKIDDPLVCAFCQRSYVDQHRYEVHVRTHTGETPFHCELCGKGFRDDRKMKLHMARHNSGLSHKCHLCPRSFEGPKALEKHLKAHEMGRYVAPKVIQRHDGTMAMALPEDPNHPKKPEVAVGQPDPEAGPTGEVAAAPASVTVVTMCDPAPAPAELPAPAATEPEAAASPAPTAEEEEGGPSEGGGGGAGDPSMISLSVDDLYQYSVAQTSAEVAPAPQPDNVDIHDKLSEGAAKVVPLGLDEFMAGSEFEKPKASSQAKNEKKSEENHSGDFPDLLDSDHSLATLNSNFDYNQYDTSDDKIDQLLKTATIKEEESGLTFATLSGLNPVYNSVDLSSLAPAKEPIVVAKKSVAPSNLEAVTDPVTEDVTPEEPVAAVATIDPAPPAAAATLTPAPLMAAAILAPAPLAAPAVALAAPEPVAAGPSSLTFTIQYPGPAPAPAPAVAAPPPSLPTLPQEPDPSVMMDSEEAEGLEEGQIGGDMSLIRPILPASDPRDPTKETFTYTTNTGQKIEVPTIITSGYDFDNLLCLFCDKQQFKNDKTLINHLLNHFGVAPKMATCPICGLSLQKKSFARHVRLHGDVKPEICPHCKKEFREKRSLEKHIRAIHDAERPYPCEHCTESFRNPIELKNHINRHLKDYPFKCDVCSMTFQKQEALTTHYRLHTGEKPYVCPICDKKFTSEKNKRVHVLRHQGSLPHKCEVCNMTFQSKSHLDKHASSHNRKTQVINAKINTFLESFGASLEEFGLDESEYGAGNDISLHSATESGEIEDASIRLSVDNLPDTDNLEAAAAEAAFAFGGDLPDDFIKFDGAESVDSSEKGSDFGTPEPPSSGQLAGANTGSAPSLVNGLTEEEAERMAKAELAADIPATADGTHLCRYCNTKLGNKRSYIIHLRRHAGMLNFKCKYCTKTFQGRVKLNRHMNTHFRDGTNVTPPPAGPGPAAGTTTINTAVLLPPAPPAATALSTATTTITPVPAPASVMFNCTMCSKIFADKETLQEHTRMHLIADVKAKFSSPVSKDKTKSSSALSPGVSTSAESKETKYSYTCNLCNQVFLDNEQWKAHKTSHGSKTWKCKYCSVLLEERSLLADHLSEIHSVSKGNLVTIFICINFIILIPTSLFR